MKERFKKVSCEGSRVRVTSACMSCKKKKTKCEDNRPCTNCRIHNWECIPTEATKRGPRKVNSQRKKRKGISESSSPSSSSSSSPPPPSSLSSPLEKSMLPTKTEDESFDDMFDVYFDFSENDEATSLKER
ncbi:hypothetical protein C1645_732683 [Glomus cerebriforme]|uniref:Zn(2)-C6 fungal-type domain-containing protein n=1 Tax=Glomus cerebriforme TaxID=658196 RepID=A0A397TJT0_9GLOM|nr:hypothetical protein C1645_732683 [Glomus cerebriforme]